MNIAQVADTLGSATAPLVSTSTALIAAGAYLLTNLVGKGAGIVEEKLAGVDGAVKSRIGPLLPVVAMGASILIPRLGLPGVDPIALVNAPTTALAAVVINEVLRKWIKPLISRKLGV